MWWSAYTQTDGLAGFRPVGQDFPVFLHPVTHEEYALARTERKSGRGYSGFNFIPRPTLRSKMIWYGAT